MYNIIDVCKNFNFKGKLVHYKLYGSGHINDSYQITFIEDNNYYKRYLLQRVNHNVFNNVEELMSNIYKVTNYLHKVIKNEGGNPLIESLTLIMTKDGQYFYKDSLGNYWRAYHFIEEGIGYDLIVNKEHFYQSAIMFGKFQKILNDFPTNEIYDVIPNFHNTKLRYEFFLEVLNADAFNRKDSALNEIEFINNHKKYYSKIVDLLEKDLIPTRVTHNDTKLNNVLISTVTNKGVTVIDLDTIMKGSILYDFGDSIRFGASTALEDEKDLSKVNFDINLFEIFTKGFLGEVKDIITKEEINNLVNGALIMTIEVGIRFLTDYLNNDVYFKTKYSDHNLVRARTQIKLFSEMLKYSDKMNDIINKYI